MKTGFVASYKTEGILQTKANTKKSHFRLIIMKTSLIAKQFDNKY